MPGVKSTDEVLELTLLLLGTDKMTALRSELMPFVATHT